MTGRLDAFQRRHPWAGFPVAVVYKFVEDQGAYLAALITYYGFLSLFPLLLLLASVLGFVLQDDPELRDRLLDSAIRQFPVLGDQLSDPQGLQGSTTAVVVGALVALYGALGIAQAVQNAMNVAWSVPRHRRPNPIRARLRSLLLLGTAGLAVLATTSLSILAGGAAVSGARWAGPVAVGAVVAAVAMNTAVFVVAFRLATALPLRTADVLVGAIGAAVIWQVLQGFGTAYAAYVVRDSSATYGAFALVLGLLGWLFLVASGVVLCVEVNVVRAKRLYPRALLTPFTDDVDLTRADQRSYTDAATAQRHKGFESVDVSFEHDGQNRSARRAARRDDQGGPDDGASAPP